MCARCQKTKESAAFNRSKRNKDGLHSYCRDCHKAHYRGNAVQHQVNVRRTSSARLAQLRDLIVVRLRSGCVDCGITDLRVLEFDHVRGEKIGGVSELVRSGRSFAVIQAEMDKCEVRCRNCHAIVTAERRPRSWHSAYLEPVE